MEEKENKNEELETMNSANVQGETQPEKDVEEKQGATMEELGGVDELYEAFKNHKKVQLPPWLIDNDGKMEIDTQELFKYILETQPIRLVQLENAGEIAIYKYENGKYRLWGENEIKAYIKSFLPTKIRKSTHWERVYKELKTEFTETKESDLNANEDIINFKNCILNIKTGAVLEHDPKYLSTIQIPCNYIPNAMLPQAPFTHKFLMDITGLNADDIMTILEMIGAIISNVSVERFKKMFILQGKGNTGKSVLREFIISLVGVENTHTVDMVQLNGRFGVASLRGKRLGRKWRLKV